MTMHFSWRLLRNAHGVIDGLKSSSSSVRPCWQHCHQSGSGDGKSSNSASIMYAQYCRHFASSTNCGSDNGHHRRGRRSRPHVTVRAENPFDILGIPESSIYQDAKRRFIELALQHHPDKTPDDTEKAHNMEQFVRFRQAFEILRDDGNGMATTDAKDESSVWSSDEEFNAWFYEETGHSDILFRMDIVTRKKVIDVANNQVQGGMDRGGMWEMARKMAEQEEILKDRKQNFDKTPLGVEGSKDIPSSSSSVRRKRKRGE